MNLSNKLEIEYEYNGKKLKSNSRFIVVKERSKDEIIEVNHNIFITKENENIYELISAKAYILGNISPGEYSAVALPCVVVVRYYDEYLAEQIAFDKFYLYLFDKKIYRIDQKNINENVACKMVTRRCVSTQFKFKIIGETKEKEWNIWTRM